MKRAIIVLAALSAACAPTTTTETKTVATTTAISDPALTARFTKVLWPTIMDYRYYGQGDPQSPPGPNSDMAKFKAVLAPGATVDIKHRAQGIGEVLGPDGVELGETNNVNLANTSITELKGSDATVLACYTYDFTARSEYPHTNDHAVPGASEVTFTLRKTTDWLVSDIANNHTVPDCQPSKA
ncbi:hypothetical protein [Mycobacteroides abscessus]|uniref:Lipoprotein n=2 Tax=Mycobacteroides abscessus TaxID=36809 RepID=A0A0U0ZMP6_9MYCO|nr:hypothetical protein [Mycobacteroides abscessus]WJJ55713.1 polymorphic toxin immunity protein [Mycobacterium phage prophiT48-1]WJJ55930.1 polymorphic immunity protein [Mycobacterium phage prophiT36-1]WJJ56027.1 polymorphic toxin immunity protein [Mycobacterium phage prophiT49-1]EIU63087.1 hypothetical protein MM1S1510930_3426 [Mycobacteroides abscessus subsp. bolletii 1S-151-0930]EIU69960.1 hypothetical protein MM1S1520914_3632 [Mycobacteroides abscessus subsp. bolletii 1S-152-0914]